MTDRPNWDKLARACRRYLDAINDEISDDIALGSVGNDLKIVVNRELPSAATQTAEQAPQDGWRTAFQAMDGWLSRMIDQIEGLPEGERIDGQHDAYVRAAGVVSLAMQYPERAKAEIFNLPAGSPVTETTTQDGADHG